MPVLPEEALQKLLCSSCKKYLSVFPVKVYPNKNVQCGRCEDKNGGTTSRLYELVAKQFEFPCINHYEGCKDVLPASSVKKHETTCYSNKYACPLCPEFNGSAYDLLDHLRMMHKSAELENADFLIEMDRGTTSEVYFYCKPGFLVIVSYQYDASVHELTLSLDIFGKERVSQQNIMHQFLLYSVQNKLQYKTGDLRSSNSNRGDEKVFAISLLKDKYPKNIIFCKFRVWDPTLVMKKYQYTINDGSLGQAILTFKFDNIAKLDRTRNTYSKFKYWVGDIFWELLIRRSPCTDKADYLEVYLRRKDITKKCKVICTINLISLIPAMNVSTSFIQDNFKNSWGNNDFISWNELFGEKEKFVREDSIEFQVLLEVLPLEECTAHYRLIVT